MNFTIPFRWKFCSSIALVALVLTMAFPFSSVAQQSTERRHITGVIKNESGESLPGATVMVVGTMMGVSSGPTGEFALDVPMKKGEATKLEVSFIGFETKQLELGNKSKLEIVLKEGKNLLNDVTVVAYGSRTKKELVNSISSVKAEDIMDMPAANIENLLQGQMAGVSVTNQSGSPGGTGSIINIRGQNSLLVAGPDGNLINDGSPLYVVDGIPIVSGTDTEVGVSGLADIDPSTIESVEVLKDASAAALYGSRANNGVILITTKQGKEGAAVISANLSVGFATLPKTPVQTIGKAERQWAWLFAMNSTKAYWDRATGGYVLPGSYEDSYGTGGTYDYFWGDGVSNMGSYIPALQDSLNPYYNNSSNWWDYFFQVGKVTNANVSLSGGTELAKYNVGVGYYNEEGIMVGSAFRRFNLSGNFVLTPRKNLKITWTNYMAYTDRGKGGNSNNGSATMVGSPKSTSSLFALDNDLALLQADRIASTVEKNNTYRLRSGLKLELQLAKDLSFSSMPSVDYAQVNVNTFEPAALDNVYGLSYSQNVNSRTIIINWENILNYNHTFKQVHNFGAMLGQGYTHQINDGAIGVGQGMASDDIHYVPQIPDNAVVIDQNGNQVVVRNFSSSFSESYLLSYFGRVTYNYDKKYLLEATLRADGSSTFGDGNRWGMFPSVALGWNFSDESFMENAWWLNSGKVRASWGVTGNQFGDPYLAQGTVSDANSPYFMGNAGLAPDQVSYNQLQWEESTQYGIGADMDMFDFRVKLNFDYYYKYNKDQIYNAPLPGDVYYADETFRNTFSTSNQGIELGLQVDVLRDKEVNWRTRFNFARNTNRFEESYNDYDVDNFVLGRPLMGFNVYIQDGYINSEDDIPSYYGPNGSVSGQENSSDFYPTQVGMKKMKDLNGDGRINDLDKTYVGSALPKMTGGWVNDLTYKNWSLNILMTYTLGRSVINAVEHSSYLSSSSPLPGVFFGDYSDVDYWNAGDYAATGDGYNPFYASPNLGYPSQSDVMVNTNIEDVNYLRLKKVNLSYNFDKELVGRIGLSSARVFFTAENLFLITNYSGMDPEAIPYTGVDNLDNYPLPRVYTIGCSVKL